jgi:tetratricopeptide (TPR) repeat protein
VSETPLSNQNKRNINLSRYGLHLGIFLLIIFCLASYIPPTLLFQDSIPTGGDTASHYAAASYFLDTILPHGRIVGWMPGHFAGFPLFQYYFPLPFLLMAVLELLMPLSLAFKWVTVLGICTLPLAAFAALRAMDFPFPVPSLGALSTLPFLFMEANSMWGGNIASTLAGEFAYSIALSLMVYLSGRLYRDIHTGKHLILNALLEAVMGLSHGYPLLFFGFVSSFFLLSSDGFSRKLGYLVRLHGLAFCLMGFWIVPLLSHLHWTTPYNYVWILDGFKQLLPPILWPGAILAALAVPLSAVSWLQNRKRQRPAVLLPSLYFLWIIGLAGGFYLIAHKIGVVDIRFLPFAQLYLMLLGALGLYQIWQPLRSPGLLAVTVGFATLFWVQSQVNYIHRWARWNYGGFENCRLWPAFSTLNRQLQGNVQDPRVVYEHSRLHERAGTVRAFECLPLFSGRSTLEGLHFQGSVTSPFVFYLQSEISQEASCPFPHYNYSRFNLARGQEHLKLFNVSHFIAISPETIANLDQDRAFELEARFPPYRLYRLRTNRNRYVEPLHYLPVTTSRKNWKILAFQWFRQGDLKVPLIFVNPRELNTVPPEWPPYTGDIRRLPRVPLLQIPQVHETIRQDEILIETSTLNHPLLIKVSYHPNWRVEGAETVYLVSPSFMVVYPKAHRVRLKFEAGIPESLGLGLSYLGVLLILVSCICAVTLFRRIQSPRLPIKIKTEAIQQTALVTWGRRLHRFLVFTALFGFFVYAATVHHRDPTILYNRGKELLERGDYEEARTLLAEAIEEFPLSPVCDFTLYLYAVSFFKQGNWGETIVAFQRLVDQYPESRLVAEAYYHMGLCQIHLDRPQDAHKLFNRVIKDFPDSRWAALAKGK